MDNFNVYEDIKDRTNGEIYIGVVGPVRSGKSTFIKRFMELMVIPEIFDENERMEAMDELPQSGKGTMVMTTEPKFVPKNAVNINIAGNCNVNVRLIDCVGFMIPGADGEERMVNTPWEENEVKFSRAAELGTSKVIKDHSTIGIVITSDGNICDIERDNYITGENKAINELKKTNKPMVVILNTKTPYNTTTQKIAEEIMETHNVICIPLDCDRIKKEDVTKLFQNILMAFPVTEIKFNPPKWLDILEEDHPIKENLFKNLVLCFGEINVLNDLYHFNYDSEGEYIKDIKINDIDTKSGKAEIQIEYHESYYYKTLSELTGTCIDNEYTLIKTIRDLSSKKNNIAMLSDAYKSVEGLGYGVAISDINKVTINDPILIRSGNKYGVKLTAITPSIHMISADIETEISPIVGTREQAEDLISYINETKESSEGIWETNIFGKTVKQLIDEGINTKINRLSEDSKDKLRETIKKVINDSNGGLVCIII